MPTLFTYRLTHDTGFAPNPYWGICTLVTCKPGIRKSAQAGDWVAAFLSVSHGERTNRLAYAMQVTRKLTLEEYDAYARRHLPGKIPDLRHRDHRRRVGDCIFDYSSGPRQVRRGIHYGDATALRKDVDGKFALLSSHFYYFGSLALIVPLRLRDIIPKTQGNRAGRNDPFVDRFIIWLESRGCEPNRVLAPPVDAVSLSACPSCVKEPVQEKVESRIC